MSNAAHALAIYSNSAGAFCSFHSEDHEESATKKFPHGAIVCPPEPNLKCMDKGDRKVDCLSEKKALLLDAINHPTKGHSVLEDFSFHMMKPTSIKEREKVESRLPSDVTAVEITTGFEMDNFKKCQRNHVVKGMQYHHDGELTCGLLANPDIFTVRKMRKAKDDATYEIGYNRTHRLCGVGEDKMLTCRNVCETNMPNFGCRHKNDKVNASARFQIFEIRGRRGAFTLEPWQGPYKRMK